MDNMKIDCIKKTIAILAALTFGCAVAFAAPAPDSNSPAHGNKGPAAQRPVPDFLQELSEKLNLTDAQKAAIKPILATEANEIKAVLQDNSLSKEQQKTKLSGIRESSDKKINALLTPEQQAKWAKLKEHAKQERNKKNTPGA
jgi:periplasmic protein CpxP/Spy